MLIRVPLSPSFSKVYHSISPFLFLPPSYFYPTLSFSFFPFSICLLSPSHPPLMTFLPHLSSLHLDFLSSLPSVPPPSPSFPLLTLPLSIFHFFSSSFFPSFPFFLSLSSPPSLPPSLLPLPSFSSPSQDGSTHQAPTSTSQHCVA